MPLKTRTSEKTCKRDDYSFNELRKLSGEELMDVATNIVNECDEKRIQYFKTYRSNDCMVTYKGQHFVCEKDYAKQIILIDEMLNYNALLNKYINSNLAVNDSINNSKIKTATKFKMLTQNYLSEVYSKKLDTEEFDKFIKKFVDFMHENVGVETKVLPIFKIKKSKITNVVPYNEKLQNEFMNYFDYVNLIATSNNMNKK